MSAAPQPAPQRTSRANKFGITATPGTEDAPADEPPGDTAASPPASPLPEPAGRSEVAASASDTPPVDTPQPDPAPATAGETQGAPPAAPAEGMPLVPNVQYQQDPTEHRVKDWGMVPQSLQQTLEMARMQWSVLNQQWVIKHGASPHSSGFKEALLRLGLKHINDPELRDLIPPDRRRSRVRNQLDTPE